MLGIPAPEGPCHEVFVAGVDLHGWCGVGPSQRPHILGDAPEVPLLELLHFVQQEKLLLSYLGLPPGRGSLSQGDLWLFQLFLSLGIHSP